MTWFVCLWAVLVFIALSALFSGSETGIYCANRLRLRLHSDRGLVRARRVRSLLEDEQQALAVILVGTNVANYLATVAAALLISRQFDLSDRQVELYTTLLVAPVLFVFGEVLPKNLFQRDPDRLLYRCSLALVVARKVLFPVVWGIRRISALVIAMVASDGQGQGPLNHRERVAALLREALADGDNAQAHGQLVERALQLSDTPIRSVMVPVGRVTAVSADADRAAFLEVVRRSRHSRFPVYEGDRTRIIGAVHVHALLSDSTWRRVGERVQAAPNLPPDASVASTMVQVRRARLRLAIVQGADGPWLGIATLQDLFEGIVGELDAW